jgi:hypothetical protein
LWEYARESRELTLLVDRVASALKEPPGVGAAEVGALREERWEIATRAVAVELRLARVARLLAKARPPRVANLEKMLGALTSEHEELRGCMARIDREIKSACRKWELSTTPDELRQHSEGLWAMVTALGPAADLRKCFWNYSDKARAEMAAALQPPAGVASLGEVMVARDSHRLIGRGMYDLPASVLASGDPLGELYPHGVENSQVVIGFTVDLSKPDTILTEEVRKAFDSFIKGFGRKREGAAGSRAAIWGATLTDLAALRLLSCRTDEEIKNLEGAGRVASINKKDERNRFIDTFRRKAQAAADRFPRMYPALFLDKETNEGTLSAEMLSFGFYRRVLPH